MKVANSLLYMSPDELMAVEAGLATIWAESHEEPSRNKKLYNLYNKFRILGLRHQSYLYSEVVETSSGFPVSRRVIGPTDNESIYLPFEERDLIIEAIRCYVGEALDQSPRGEDYVNETAETLLSFLVEQALMEIS